MKLLEKAKPVAFIYLVLSILWAYIPFLCGGIGIHLICLILLGVILPFILLLYRGPKKEKFFAWGIIIYFCITFFSTFAYAAFGPQSESGAVIFFAGIVYSTVYVFYPMSIWKRHISKNSQSISK